MAKRTVKKPDAPAKSLPLIDHIEALKAAARDLEPVLDAMAKRPQPHELKSEVVLLRVADLVSEALDAARSGGSDRAAVAAEISRIMDMDTMAANRLNKLSAASQEQYNARPDEIIGLRWATKNTALIEYLCESCGGHFVQPEEYRLIQLGQLVETETVLTETKLRLLGSRGGQS